MQLSKRHARRPWPWNWKEGRRLSTTTTTTTTLGTTGTSVLSTVYQELLSNYSATENWRNEVWSDWEPAVTSPGAVGQPDIGRHPAGGPVLVLLLPPPGATPLDGGSLDEILIGNTYNLTGSSNISEGFFAESSDFPSLLSLLFLSIVFGFIILSTIIGNLFVIAAILVERHLQNVANYLILSLAVADLLVACLVMPLSAVYEISDQWTLGPQLCDMWTSSDVLCCTASILHLVAIALDRYWAVTNIDYIHQRTRGRIGLMILVIWSVSFMVCIAPVLGWKDPGWEQRISENRTCIVSQDIGYQVFATASSFYLPLLVILFLYWRIFQTARKRIRRRFQATAGGCVGPGGSHGPGSGTSGGRHPQPGGVIAGLCAAGATGGNGGIAAAVVGVIGRPLPTISEATTTTTTTAFTNVSSTNTSPEKGSYGNGLEADPPTADLGSSAYQPATPQPPPKARKSREDANSKRERKAAKTLAIITGAFVICWLPFFIIAILLPICNMYQMCVLSDQLFAFFLWLGYFNSTLNPIIYTIFSPEFRQAFKRILFGRRGGGCGRRSGGPGGGPRFGAQRGGQPAPRRLGGIRHHIR